MVKGCQKSQTHFEIRVSRTLQITFRSEWWICRIRAHMSVRSVRSRTVCNCPGAPFWDLTAFAVVVAIYVTTPWYCVRFLWLAHPRKSGVLWILLHLPLFFICLREISHKVYCFELSAWKTGYKATNPEELIPRWLRDVAIIAELYQGHLYFLLNSFFTLKCLSTLQLKILIPFSELSLYVKLASRLPNWKHLDGILNLGHFFFKCVFL